jgi:predicted dehydrogenase
MKWQMPTEVRGRIVSARGNKLSPSSPPTAFQAEMVFGTGASLSFYCSFVAHMQNWAHIGGAKGYLRLPGFVHPVSIHEPSFELNGEEQKVTICDCNGAHTESKTMAQDTRMFRNFAAQIATGKLNVEWPQWALKTQQVMDACYGSALAQGRAVQMGE